MSVVSLEIDGMTSGRGDRLHIAIIGSGGAAFACKLGANMAIPGF